jgi:hypothetical protein
MTSIHRIYTNITFNALEIIMFAIGRQ